MQKTDKNSSSQIQSNSGKKLAIQNFKKSYLGKNPNQKAGINIQTSVKTTNKTKSKTHRDPKKDPISSF